MIDLDFLVQLNQFINAQGLYAKSYIGLLREEESLSVMAMPGGAEIVYMDDSRNKAYQVQINAKSKRHDNCIMALNHLFSELERLTDLPSGNLSYDFHDINITSLPSFIHQDEQGYFIYSLSISANLNIYKGVI